jgi:hypothetical protein
VVADGCWCPSPQCDPHGACLCGGGPFLGCVAAVRNCPSISCGLLGSASPDGTGCLACAPPLDCASARDRLKSVCGFADSFLVGMTCSINPACVAACLNKLGSCADVGCSFCDNCQCGGARTPFTDCYTACLAG